ncbi:MAG: hypothetical protein ACI9LN_000549 [Saprospiraceae bacterium]|jgi:hypothetical protein
MTLKIGELSPLQLESLKVYSFSPTEQELIEIKHILAQFFAKKLVKKVSVAIDKKGITAADLESWVRGE